MNYVQKDLKGMEQGKIGREEIEEELVKRNLKGTRHLTGESYLKRSRRRGRGGGVPPRLVSNPQAIKYNLEGCL